MAAPDNPGADRYRTTLADLEAAVRVPFEAQLESQSSDVNGQRDLPVGGQLISP